MPCTLTTLFVLSILATEAAILVVHPQDGSDLSSIISNSDSGTPAVSVQYNFNITTMLASSTAPSNPLNAVSQKLEVMMLSQGLGLISMIRKSTLDGSFSYCQSLSAHVSLDTSISAATSWQALIAYNLSSCILKDSNQSAYVK